MKFYHFPRACPNALTAICAPFFNDRDLRFLQFDRIFRADPDAASAVVALARSDVDHQKWFGHGNPAWKLLFLYGEEFDLEDEISIRRNNAPGTPAAVAQLGRNKKF